MKFSEDKQITIDRLIYGTLPHTLNGQNNLALIGPRATSLSDEICKNVAFRFGLKKFNFFQFILKIFKDLFTGMLG